MTDPDRPLPTDAEMQILNVLWERGPSTVRDVIEGMDEDKQYTTVLKQLQIMHEKGLVGRDESTRPHVYEPRAGQADTQRRLLDDLLEKAFGGSTRRLVMRALSQERASEEELLQLRELLDELEEDR